MCLGRNGQGGSQDGLLRPQAYSCCQSWGWMCSSRTCSPWTSPCSARNVNNFLHALQVGGEKAKQFVRGRAAVQQQGWEKIRRQQGLVAPRFTGVRLSTWHHSVVSSPPSLHASCLLFSSQHTNPASLIECQRTAESFLKKAVPRYKTIRVISSKTEGWFFAADHRFGWPLGECFIQCFV